MGAYLLFLPVENIVAIGKNRGMVDITITSREYITRFT